MMTNVSRPDSISSWLATLRNALQLDEAAVLQVVPAAAVAQRHHPPLGPDQPALITECTPHLLAQIKPVLLNAYPPTIPVTLVEGLGQKGEQRRPIPLAEADQHSDVGPLFDLFVPPDPANAGFITFQETIAHLRAPDGCPWDREQTHLSLRPYLLEEAFEVLEALDAQDPAALAEELGDLLLQIVLHAQIATDNNDFRMGHLVNHINQKMLRRHPHVFGAVTVSGSGEVLTNWQAIKKAEKQAKGEADPNPSVLDSVPAALPALSQAMTISERVVRIGFEWPNIEGVLDKLIEEAREIATASTAENLEAEIGDFLFSAVNLARWQNIDAESALRATNARFSRRFRRVEALAAARGKHLPDMTLEEMELLWQQAKAIEG